MAKRRRVTFKSKKGKKISFITSGSYKQSEEECNHSWHLVNFFRNPFVDSIYEATFICSSCGILKILTNPNLKEQEN